MTNIIETEQDLDVCIDSKKSFYGKAKVIEIVNKSEQTGIIKLISYSTNVASVNIDMKTGVRTAKVYGTYSATTLRHIKDFLWQNGFDIGNKKFIEETYIN